VQLKGAIANDDRMSCIITALIADNDICGAAQQVGNFAFTFITPLRPNNNYISQGSLCSINKISQSSIITKDCIDCQSLSLKIRNFNCETDF
jgi:hypothetical protein